MSKKRSIIFKNLLRIYRDPKDPGSLGGVERLRLRAKKLGNTNKRQVIKDFLATKRSYSYHKQVPKHFVRNRTVVGGIDTQWQADLADMQNLASDNDDVKYLLTCIDVFSKFAWVVPIKNKTTKEMLLAFQKLFTVSKPRKPKRFQTDKGTEFLNNQVQHLLKNEYHIEHFTTMGETKAAVVERFNRTLKERIWRYFTQSNGKRYIDVLDGIVYAYNNSIHRSIKMKPSEVKKCDEPVIWRRLFGNGEGGKSATKNLCSGDNVRISKYKGDFAKGYEPNWTEEEFVVKSNESSQQPKQVYKIEDFGGEPILGSFYSSQLQKIEPCKDYIIQNIIRERVDQKTKIKYLLVKWEGWPEKFNTWIPESNINNGK